MPPATTAPPARPDADALPQPSVPDAVRTATEAAFAGLSRLRRARGFHPRGRSFTATLTPEPGQPLPGIGDQPRRALVRLSNAIGLPASWPEVLGLGIRILDGAGPGLAQDLLLTSSGEPPVGRHLLRPARGFDTTRFSSMLLYETPEGRRLVGARCTTAPPSGPVRLADVDHAVHLGCLAFSLDLATTRGPWQPLGVLRLEAPLPPAESAALRFNPWRTGPQLRPIGVLNHIRAAAYDGSTRGATSE